ncbi:MAG: alcohol dehydrogenase catalytic domain-containing protein [Patescibacteria group bacterium]
MKNLAIEFKQGKLKLNISEINQPKEDEILIKIDYVGICGTDLQIINGLRPDTARILGHEGIGKIIAVGNKINNFQAKQSVVFNPVDPTNQNRILGHSYNGIFQNFFVMSHKDLQKGMLIKSKLDKTILGCLVEPLATVIYGFSLITKKIKPESIAVIGAGPIGLLNFLYAKLNICQQVILINKSENKLDWIKKNKFSQRQYLIKDTKDLVTKIMSITDNQGVDAIILCVPRSDGIKALNKAVKYIKTNGCINLVGGVSDKDNIRGSGFDLNSIRKANVCGRPITGMFKEITLNGKKIILTGHRGASTDHLKQAMIELNKNSKHYLKIITHILNPYQAIKVLNKISRLNIKKVDNKLFIKGVIKFN